ncbi:NFACT family protein [Fusibacter paucivorans]|uniref:Rqc2 homolog RqcH n=1 Tax=Fusibacter paucivorans TaxID=76009 RepID=A0ABS5PQI3_9FIRM|nr:NFACT RNA binding domain-containing protein [Fusibacter paucivorans]MBS7527424.1 NFACT family protein [Fusibacter paucivorans]
MSFDGMFIHYLCQEIAPKLVDGRIDKIHQPEKDELTLSIKGRGGTHTLFISVDSSIPYFTLTTQKKENPQQPPMFCMLLRKHLLGSRILAFKQIGYERIIEIDIEGRNDFGEIETKKLFLEIMGKHSNLILTREDDTIIDSIKRISLDMSRIRTILPGGRYWIIPNHKISPESTSDVFIESLRSQLPNQKLVKGLYSAVEGFSPFFANILISQTACTADIPLHTVPDEQLKTIWQILQPLLQLSAPSGYLVSDPSKGPASVYFVDTHLDYQVLTVYETLGEALEQFYGKTNRTLKMHQRLTDIRKTIQIKYDRSASKLIKLHEERNEADHAEKYKIMGELLYANLYQLSKGMNKATLQNYYDDADTDLEIPLDVRLDPNENAQHYFKRYTKLKTAQKLLDTQISETEEMMHYLENVLTHMETVESQADIAELLAELAEQGFIRKKYSKRPSKSQKPEIKTYRSSDGFEILVGKNNYQNDYLTLKVASNKDLWFHTKIIPGSHVIIRTKGVEVPEQTLIEAATIAAYYSKAKQSSNVPVDYTLVKHVTKPNGAKPGMVIYTHNRTLYVTPDVKMIESLKSI